MTAPSHSAEPQRLDYLESPDANWCRGLDQMPDYAIVRNQIELRPPARASMIRIGLTDVDYRNVIRVKPLPTLDVVQYLRGG